MSRVALLSAVLVGMPLGVQNAHAQYGDPMRCLPPAGQAMWEIAATNLARRYRDEPTAENKASMCNRFRSTIVVYEKADIACRKSDCTEPAFKKSCLNAREKAAVWRKRTKEECS